MKITNVHDRPRIIAATGQQVDPGDSADVDKDLADALALQKNVWSKRSHVCDVCGDSFASGRGLASHRRVHDSTDEEND